MQDPIPFAGGWKLLFENRNYDCEVMKVKVSNAHYVPKPIHALLADFEKVKNKQMAKEHVVPSNIMPGDYIKCYIPKRGELPPQLFYWIKCGKPLPINKIKQDGRIGDYNIMLFYGKKYIDYESNFIEVIANPGDYGILQNKWTHENKYQEDIIMDDANVPTFSHGNFTYKDEEGKSCTCESRTVFLSNNEYKPQDIDATIHIIENDNNCSNFFMHDCERRKFITCGDLNWMQVTPNAIRKVNTRPKYNKYPLYIIDNKVYIAFADFFIEVSEYYVDATDDVDVPVCRDKRWRYMDGEKHSYSCDVRRVEITNKEYTAQDIETTIGLIEKEKIHSWTTVTKHNLIKCAKADLCWIQLDKLTKVFPLPDYKEFDIVRIDGSMYVQYKDYYIKVLNIVLDEMEPDVKTDDEEEDEEEEEKEDDFNENDIVPKNITKKGDDYYCFGKKMNVTIQYLNPHIVPVNRKDIDKKKYTGIKSLVNGGFLQCQVIGVLGYPTNRFIIVNGVFRTYSRTKKNHSVIMIDGVKHLPLTSQENTSVIKTMLIPFIDDGGKRRGPDLKQRRRPVELDENPKKKVKSNLDELFKFKYSIDMWDNEEQHVLLADVHNHYVEIEKNLTNQTYSHRDKYIEDVDLREEIGRIDKILERISSRLDKYNTFLNYEGSSSATMASELLVNKSIYDAGVIQHYYQKQLEILNHRLEKYYEEEDNEDPEVAEMKRKLKKFEEREKALEEREKALEAKEMDKKEIQVKQIMNEFMQKKNDGEDRVNVASIKPRKQISDEERISKLSKKKQEEIKELFMDTQDETGLFQKDSLHEAIDKIPLFNKPAVRVQTRMDTLLEEEDVESLNNPLMARGAFQVIANKDGRRSTVPRFLDDQ
jgi:hypothetical protein